VEIAHHDAIGERRQVQAGLLAAAQHRGGLPARHGLSQRPCHFTGLTGESANGTAERVYQHALGMVHHLGGQLLKGQRSSIVTQIGYHPVHVQFPSLATYAVQHSPRPRPKPCDSPYSAWYTLSITVNRRLGAQEVLKRL